MVAFFLIQNQLTVNSILNITAQYHSKYFTLILHTFALKHSLFSKYFVVMLCGVRCLSDSISVPCNNCCGPGLDRLNIYNDYIILFMLQVGLHTLPLPAYHDTPAANITRVTHSHILAKYPLHRNKTERGPLSVCIYNIYIIYTLYSRQKSREHEIFRVWTESRQTKRQMFYLLNFVVFIQNIYSALKI